MKRTHKQNGITLVALIITIIVMLILVGVSVTVALNGGLFTTAEGARSKTQIEEEKVAVASLCNVLGTLIREVLLEVISITKLR